MRQFVHPAALCYNGFAPGAFSGFTSTCILYASYHFFAAEGRPSASLPLASSARLERRCLSFLSHPLQLVVQPQPMPNCILGSARDQIPERSV